MPWTKRSGYGLSGPAAGACSRRRSPMRSTAPILLQPVLGQFASPYQLSPRLTAGPFGSKSHVLGRQQRSTYIQVRLALLAPSGVAVRAEGRSPEARAGLIWLATWPRTQSGGGGVS